jgi:hypothetical protein
MEVVKVSFAFESFLARPALPDLLQQDVPLSLVPVAARRFSTEVTEGVIRRGPALQVPSARLAVGPADPVTVFLEERADRDMSVHRLEHLHAGVIETDQRDSIVERGEPIFVLCVLIGNEIGDVPCKEEERVS